MIGTCSSTAKTTSESPRTVQRAQRYCLAKRSKDGEMKQIEGTEASAASPVLQVPFCSAKISGSYEINVRVQFKVLTNLSAKEGAIVAAAETK